MKTTIGTLVLAALAGSASAQCNIYRYGIPDFDQRRDVLPGDGGMYCAPTAALNLMAYIASHGDPNAMNGHSSPNWAAPGEYALVSLLDSAMGANMGTDPVAGTQGGALDGLRAYRDDRDVSAIVLGRFNREEWQISPKYIHDCLKAGNLVTMCYGRYKQEDGAWVRKGGHCVTVCSVQDACGQTPIIGFKDPWTGDSDSLDTQSPFKTATWTTIKRVRNFGGQVYYQWGKYGEHDAETQRYIDSMLIVSPLFALTEGPTETMFRYTAKLLNNDPTPPIQAVAVPARVLAASRDLRRTSTYVLTAATDTAPARLWTLGDVDNQLTHLLDLPMPPGAFAMDRHGDLLLTLKGEIRKYRSLDDGSLSLLAKVEHGHPFDSLAVDDATGDVFALAGQTRRLLRFPGGNLNGAPVNGPLAASVVVGASAGVTVNPADGDVWLSSQGSDRIYQLKWAVGAQEWRGNVFVQTPQGTLPTGLQFGDRGDMAFISQGRIREWERVNGAYAPSDNPRFADLPASGFLSLGRSRDNFVPAEHSGPAWVNVEDPDSDTTDVLDCPADFNGDGFVDGIDADLFNNLFEAGNMDADVNSDGFVDGIDADSFNNWFEAGC